MFLIDQLECFFSAVIGNQPAPAKVYANLFNGTVFSLSIRTIPPPPTSTQYRVIGGRLGGGGVAPRAFKDYSNDSYVYKKGEFQLFDAH